jgi:hypothetical protein
MKRLLMIVALAAALPAAAEEMKPNQPSVPSPSDLRGAAGEDRPQGQAREARTPSPSDIATERPRTDGDRPTSQIQDPRNAAAGASRPSLPEDNRGQPIR